VAKSFRFQPFPSKGSAKVIFVFVFAMPSEKTFYQPFLLTSFSKRAPKVTGEFELQKIIWIFLSTFYN
jgi:hypothetical protein